MIQITNFLEALVKIPEWLQVQNKHICWKVKTDQNELYLTFDDGPYPKATPEILDILHDFNVKATFFCIGRNVDKHTELYYRILDEGHGVGNHSWSHPNGWKQKTEKYVEDVNKAAAIINTKNFRPPYGKITPSQFRQLRKEYAIIMWDVFGKDYDPSVSDQQVISNVTDNVDKGSIIVLHDNEKTADRMSKILPPVLDKLKKEGWSFSKL